MDNTRIVIEHQVIDSKSQIFNLVKRIREAKDEIKNIREMTTELLERDSAYNEIQDQAKTASKDKQQMREKLMDSAEGFKLKEKMSDAKLELKDLESTLSTSLEVYTAKTGQTFIETEMGMKISISKKFSISPNQIKLFD